MPVLDLRPLANGSDENSFSNRMRTRRFQLFERLAAPLPRPLRIIDLGGTNEFWERRGWADKPDVEIVTVNLEAEERLHENIIPTQGDATDLAGHPDASFDIAFSNSVIEHLFTLDAQTAMAREVRRVATAYWVQTPNFWFPIEPHFHVPAWQWMPRAARVAVIQRRRVGWRGPCPNPEDAGRAIDEIRLMRRSELQAIFPDATLHAERFQGLVKSWIAMRGFPAVS
jgi:hypothetical protein